MDNEQVLILRAKKLGVLIRDARQAAGKQIKECAEALEVSNYMFGAFERGEKSPSLPELEVLAYYLDIPIKHFWANKVISEAPHPTEEIEMESFLDKRNRIIGVLLRNARNEKGYSLKELSERIDIPSSRISRYEDGKNAVPLPELEIISRTLDRSTYDFLDQQSQVGEWIVEQSAVQDFLDLPKELQDFLSKPINRPYVELAERLSHMSAEKLREVAENLLEISL